jgi:hypothetical protein
VSAGGREAFFEVELAAGAETLAEGGFFFRAAGLLAERPQPATATMATAKTANTIRRQRQNSLGHISISQITRHPICS